MGYFHLSINSPDFVQIVDFGGHSSVHTPNLIINDDRQCQIIEDICAISPYIESSVLMLTGKKTYFPDAFIIKSVGLSNLPGFMISPDQSDSIGILEIRG